ncbi:hypothetical protein WOLCODRAFT_137242 [Wolfiporia cocos MD-104 SS10]|uniref:Uncharacterized protein n=1 Tax=Wolfiporia cocos (strain MD-104) TaxID=742152 RepID=A0A2H3JH32_WOLCO|nr:hypothetical protein WOLCODRAFT_137242 [Wolfiporia cocos MD-104 SS10]
MVAAGDPPPPYSPAPNSSGGYRHQSSTRNASTRRRDNERQPLMPPGPNVSYATITQHTTVHIPQRDGVKWMAMTTILVLLCGFIAAFSVQTIRLNRLISTVPPSPEERARLRLAWNLERKEHALEQARWMRERREQQESLARLMRERSEEEAAHTRERVAWARERERMEEEQEEWRTEQFRKLGVSWGRLSWGRCIAYGTREYSAELQFDGKRLCEQTPINIHGRTIQAPDFCGAASRGQVKAHWHVNFTEPGCQPHWGGIYDKGCVGGQGSGLHRWESRLMGIASGEDWMTLCSTAPADIGGLHFDAPTACENRGFLFGMVGIFEAADYQCL